MRYVAGNFGQHSAIRMQIPKTSAAEMSAVGAQRNNLGHDNSRCSHQRQTDEWLTRRAEQLHRLAVFA